MALCLTNDHVLILVELKVVFVGYMQFGLTWYFQFFDPYKSRQLGIETGDPLI